MVSLPTKAPYKNMMEIESYNRQYVDHVKWKKDKMAVHGNKFIIKWTNFPP